MVHALRALAGPHHQLHDAVDHIPTCGGLYAIHGPAHAWEELGLGTPPDDRPLYVGKSEDSLVSRDLRTHFGDKRTTGSSTVRRSIAALLRDTLSLRGMPRNLAKPERPSNYGLSSRDEQALGAWMASRLSIAVWAKPMECSILLSVETAVIAELKPPLNLRDNLSSDWSSKLAAARSVMAHDARAWAREHGFEM